jgi:diketogulonate reductase-like aldo/keto reductase
MTALRYLQDMQRDGHINALGLVNFDAVRTDEICTQLGPGSIVSNQVQVCLVLPLYKRKNKSPFVCFCPFATHLRRSDREGK